MRYAGRLIEWHDDKGYGFVVPNGGGDRAFVHAKAFERMGRRPQIDDLLSYEATRDAQGRLAATAVRFAGTRAPSREPRGRVVQWRIPLALACLSAIAIAGWLGKLPMIVLGVYGIMSVVAILVYAHDKQAARAHVWRTEENTLHAIAVFGGWPGALLAQGLLRHKSSKPGFQGVFWLTVVLNCIGLAWALQQVA